MRTSTRETGPRLRHVVERGAGVVWVGAAGFVLALGIIAAIVLLGWIATTGLFLLITVSGWLWSGLRWLLEEDPGSIHFRVVGPVPAALVVSSIGLLGLLGLAAVPVAGLLVLVHPDVRRWLRVKAGRAHASAAGTAPERARPVRARPSSTRPSAPTVAPMVEEPDLVVTDELTDSDLCEAWRSSYVALQRARTNASRFRAVEMRVLYLDDLERRLGDDFARWMESLPRAAEDPRRFLRNQGPRG